MILPHNRFAFIMGQLRDRWSEQIKQMEFSVVRWEINRFIAMGNFNFWFLCMHTTPYCSVDVFISMKSNFDTFKLFWPPVTVFFSIQMLTRLDNAFFFPPFFWRERTNYSSINWVYHEMTCVMIHKFKWVDCILKSEQ